jgi:signal peptidase I
VERNDIVVFNWPIDTVYKLRDQSGLRVDKPIDKKYNYVKSCFGVPGDQFEIKDGIVFVNGKELILPERARPQFTYKIALDGKTPIDFEYLLQDMDITDGAGYTSEIRDTLIVKALTSAGAERLKNVPGVTAVTRVVEKGIDESNNGKGVFPHIHKWNSDNFGPIYIPQQGKTVALNLETLPFYKAIITDYEKNDLKVTGSEIRINGKIATSYTFQQNYYWMMGDNRHNSEDSRYWGYVPENHIVGKPTFIWMSYDSNAKGLKKIRWERLFTTVSGEGQPQSYFKFFLMALVAYFIGEYFWKKKKTM